MTRADNTDYLHQATADRHHATESRARAALEHLDQTGQPVTVTSVAHAAGVSRSWLYTRPELLATITTLRHRTTNPALVPTAQRATSDSLRQRLDAARTEISDLRTKNAALQDRLARALGDLRTRR